MSKNKKTKVYEMMLCSYLHRKVIYCNEVALHKHNNFYNNKYVDFLAYDREKNFICYEVKVSKKDFPVILENMIRKFIKNHKLSKVAHEEIMAMTHSDLEVARLFRKSEMDMTNKVAKILLANKFDGENIYEKVHISIAMVDNLCHEIVYHKHKELDYDKMICLVVNTITELF